MSNKPTILIIYTGGTIGMITEPGTQSLVPVDFNEISSQLPELQRFDQTLDTFTFDPPEDSSNITPSFWIRLAEVIRDNYNSYDGFVVLHGTDTMCYTASALSYMLENLEKPVIFTGSQLPIGVLRTDGKENLLTAIEIAAHMHKGKAAIPEVCIYFQNKLFRGNRTTKHNAEYFNAFVSENYPALAEAGVDIHYNYMMVRHPESGKPFRVKTGLDDRVGLLKLFPGIRREVIRSVLATPGLRGLVMETFGSGNAPTSGWFLDEIRRAAGSGLILLNITQCPAGSVKPGQYETGRMLYQTGIFNGADLTTEAAITKLMFLLGQGLSAKELANALNNSLRGEITL